MNKWVENNGIFIYHNYWQMPAKTEKWASEIITAQGYNSPLIEVICFPWATLIDLISRKQLSLADKLTQDLYNLPKKIKLFRFTVIQHISFDSVKKIIKDLGITDIFWAHKQIGTDGWDEVRLHAFPLYPFANEFKKNIKSNKLLYSFIGAYDPGCYISRVREKIFSIHNPSYGLVLRRNKWFFEYAVYETQISKFEFNNIPFDQAELQEYVDTLESSLMSLCPSGAGPNSIRYWESVAFGCIPILLSDKLDLLMINACNGTVRVPENNLLSYISDIIFLFEQGEIEKFYESQLNHTQLMQKKNPDFWLKDLFDNLFISGGMKKLLR